MADRPEKFPDWALDNVVDPVSFQNNVVEPPDARKLSGWTRFEVPPRQWFNWLFRITTLWIRYLDSRVSKADAFTVATLPSASARGAGAMIYVSNETGGAVLAFSDGTDWRRTTDRNIVS